MRRWLYISAVMWMLAGSLPAGCMLTGCKGACGSMGTCGGTRQASCGLGDVRQTLAVADSLRVNEGVAYDDSLALAEAYEVFGRYRLVCPDDYARACYYYGRMLRNRGDYVSAMQAFISGTHAPYVQRVVPLPWFSNHAILGRIYSNMGSMCHQNSEFKLAYRMYEQSATCFLSVGDTTSYYYVLNAMALQKAEQQKHVETLILLHTIEQECSVEDVLTKCWETKAIMYEKANMYDSALYAAKVLNARGFFSSIGNVIEAQAFWHMQQYDSALHYAQLVMSHPYATAKDKFNMLYIQTYNDSTLDEDEVKKRAEERADIDKEILDPLHEKLTQAATLLREDINKTPDRTWIAAVALILIIVLSVYASTHRRRAARKHELQQQEKACEERMMQVAEEETHISEQLHHLNRKQNAHRERQIQEIEQQCTMLCASKNLKRALHLSNYPAMKQMINHKFNRLVDRLETEYMLKEREIQFCILVLLNVPQKQIAELLVYSERSIKNTKANTAKKMKVTSSNLRNRLIDIILQ